MRLMTRLSHVTCLTGLTRFTKVTRLTGLTRSSRVTCHWLQVT